MSHSDDQDRSEFPSELYEIAAPLCNDFERAWEENQHPQIASYLAKVPASNASELLAILIHLEVQLRQASGERVSPKEYHQRYPEHAAAIDQAFKMLAIEMAIVNRPSVENTVHTTNQPMMNVSATYPHKIGRYEVVSELGAGGFGIVCLATDMTLGRSVALKFALKSGFRTEAHVSAFIREARTVAQLQHSGIVTVYDVLQTGEWLCIVQQFVDAGDLRSHLSGGQLTFERIAQICARTAEALAFAHEKGIIHCDIKPANILMDKQGNSYIADFGLAVYEYAQRQFAGTPSYMPPELVMGEKHRVDARCDIWSLGVMLYELLTGIRPFRGANQQEIFEQIQFREPRPPRHVNSQIPRDLERICLKCLSKPLNDRYRTALEISSDLHFWLKSAVEQTDLSGLSSTRTLNQEIEVTSPERGSTDFDTLNAVRVVPKGLQSYDAHDAEFFLHLIPGPRDRYGFPESVRFWRNWVDDGDPEMNSVGLIYGPSGCGKSSFVKAALLPNLASDVVSIYVEATHDDTESRVLSAIRRNLPSIDRETRLTKVLEMIREGQLLHPGKKLLLVFDQFEQWLNDRVPNKQDELVRALRQCDGQRVQAILLVRDDFWLATSRLMQEIEIELQQGRNAKLIDLFDLAHARKVLYEFGRNYGALPDEPHELTKQHKRFISDAVDDLAEQGRVISIRLAVFAEMFRDKPWTLTELSRMGGAQGVGFKFLESSFDSIHANPQHRSYQQQARLLLEALMPNEGQLIRGRVLPDYELQRACGLTNREKEFSELVRILDKDLRLITPAGSPTGPEESESSNSSSGVTFYQLTHDFLVGSLRDWLTQNKRATRRGRAELKLAERCESWIQKPESRRLPSGLEYATIRLLTKSSRWNSDQARMMQSATRYYGFRWTSVIFLIGACWWALATFISTKNSENLVARLLQAETSQVPEIIEEMKTNSTVLHLLDQQSQVDAITDDKERLHLELARLGLNAGNTNYLLGRLATCTPSEVTAITQVLKEGSEPIAQSAWALLERDSIDSSGRITLASALAQWDPASSRWEKIGKQLALDLVSLNAMDSQAWSKLLQPVREKLLPTIVDALADSDADHQQLRGIFAELDEHSGIGLEILEQQLNTRQPADDLEIAEYVQRSQRQARIAVTLIGLGVDKPTLWNLLDSAENPTRRSYMIELFYRFGVNPKILVNQLGKTTNPQILAGLILSLGSWRDLNRLPASLFDIVEQQYRESSSSSVHSAARWLLTSAGRRLIDKLNSPPGANWRIESQYLTTVRMVPPSQFVMSKDGAGNERNGEIGGPFHISTTEIPIGLYRLFDPDFKDPVFDSDYSNAVMTEMHPATQMSWYKAAEFCNWLTGHQGLPAEECCFELNGKFADQSDNDAKVARMALVRDWKSKKGYRMPTEAEWEFACRSETPTSWSCGRSKDPIILGNYAWYRESNEGEFSTRSVARLKPNPFGIFDMHGNASEMTIDRYVNSAEIVDNGGRNISLKGGCFFSPAFDLNPGALSRYPANSTSNHVGFRVVRVD